MAKNSALPKPDIGGTMAKRTRAAFVIFVVIVLGLSVMLSFNALSRKTFEFEYTDNYNGTGKSGYVFNGFNGEASITTVNIDRPYEKVDGEWVQTEGSVIAVESYTFNSDEYLQYINIGPDVEYIEDQAFIYCKALRAFNVDENNPYYCSVDGILYSKDMTELIAYPVCRCTQIVFDDVKSTGDVVNIGKENAETFTVNGVYKAGSESESTLFTALRTYIKTNYSGDFDYLNDFSEFTDLVENKVYSPYIGTYYRVTELTDSSLTLERFWTCDEKYDIPEGVTEIAGKAFYKCDRLVSVTLPSTVRSIGDMAFFKCTAMALVTLPDGIESLGNDAFSYCSNMNYAIFIPESMQSIGHHCFYKCNEDMDFYMGDKDESGIDLGGKWQPKNDNAFKAKDPIWGAVRAQCDEYNNTRYAEDAKAAAEAEAAAQSSNSPESSATASNGMNKKAMLVLIICFIPCFAFIGVQVIRNVFRDDFLMTKKGKARLKARKEENERIHQAYINGEFTEEKAEEAESTEAEESDEPDEKPDESGTQKEENEEGSDD